MKVFLIATKVLPILVAIIHLLSTMISYFHGNDIPLNYIGGISLLTVGYLYLASYTFRLCKYYRMYLHYSVLLDVINMYDYYIGIPISDYELFMVFVVITIITMLVIIKLKFF